jgi:hypothetical protein
MPINWNIEDIYDLCDSIEIGKPNDDFETSISISSRTAFVLIKKIISHSQYRILHEYDNDTDYVIETNIPVVEICGTSESN